MGYRVRVDRVSQDGNFLTIEEEVSPTKADGSHTHKSIRSKVLDHWGKKPIDIVVVVHDEPRTAYDCIHAINKYTEPELNWGLTVIDNASEEFTSSLLGKIEGIDQVLRMTEYGGHLPAMQIGYEQTKGVWIVFVDQRVIVTPGWLEAMLWSAMSGSRVSMVSPWSNKRVPFPAGSNYLATAEAVRHTSKWDNAQTVFPGGHMFAIKREALDQFGGFDVDFYRPGYGETADLYMRMMNSKRVAVRAAGCYVLDETPGNSEAADWMPSAGAGYSRFLARWGTNAEVAYKSTSGKDGVRKVAARMLSAKPTRPKVVFVFRELALCGAVLAIAHLCNRLIELGWDAAIYYTRTAPGHTLKHIPMRFTPVCCESPSKLVQALRELKGHVHVVGSIWTSAEDIAAAAGVNGHIVPWWYVQDDERKFENLKGIRYADPKKIEAALKMIHRKVANSAWVQKMLKGLGHESTRIAVGVDTLLFHPREKDKRVRVMVHRRASTPRRGWPFIAEVLNRAAVNCEFEVVTYDEMPEQDELSMPWRGHLGKVSPAELARHMGSAHIFFEGSEFQGQGMSGMEAMASGCALLATNNGGIVDYATHARDCLIVEHGDVDHAAGVLVRMVNDEQLRKTLGSRARNSIVAFDWENIAPAWSRLLRSS